MGLHARTTDPTSSGRAAETDLLDWLMAPLGLVLVGAGLSIAVDAASRRAAGAAPRRWLGQGTLGLVVLNSGLSVFGDSITRRVFGRA